MAALPPALKAYLTYGLARWAVPVQESGEMSIRTAVHRLVQNGRVILRSLRNNERFHSRGYADKYLDKIHVAQIGKFTFTGQVNYITPDASSPEVSRCLRIYFL